MQQKDKPQNFSVISTYWLGVICAVQHFIFSINKIIDTFFSEKALFSGSLNNNKKKKKKKQNFFSVDVKNVTLIQQKAEMMKKST